MKKDGIRAAMSEQVEKDTLKSMAQRTTNTDNPETDPKLTLTANEVFERHPLPWTHHLLLIKDANGRQVIHAGGLYGERGRRCEGAYLSGINALLVEAANSRVSASPAAPVVDANQIVKQIRDRLVNGSPATMLAEIAELVIERSQREGKCEHGILWSMECLSCGHSDYVAAASTASTQEDAEHDYAQEMAVGKRWVSYKDAAERVVARIADNDCLTCKHWASDAVYAIAVELATAPAPSSQPAQDAAREWMNTHHASFKTNQERENALAAIISRYCPEP